MSNKAKPITFSIDADTVAAIEAFKDRTNSVSTSAIIRAAIERFDFDQLDTSTKEAKQISLRIDPLVRDRLKSVAKAQGVSLGYILRECILKFVSEDQTNPLPRVGHSPNPILEEEVPKKPDNPWQI